jgi:hypothetical protein
MQARPFRILGLQQIAIGCLALGAGCGQRESVPPWLVDQEVPEQHETLEPGQTTVVRRLLVRTTAASAPRGEEFQLQFQPTLQLVPPTSGTARPSVKVTASSEGVTTVGEVLTFDPNNQVLLDRLLSAAGGCRDSEACERTFLLAFERQDAGSEPAGLKWIAHVTAVQTYPPLLAPMEAPPGLTVSVTVE